MHKVCDPVSELRKHGARVTLCGDKEEFQLFGVHYVCICHFLFNSYIWTTHKTITVTLLFPSILGSHFPMGSVLGVFFLLQ